MWKRGRWRAGGAAAYLNLAVSGSISSSSLTGERGTLAENFSVMKRVQSSFLLPVTHRRHHGNPPHL